MKDIIDLNAEIEKIAKPEIEFHEKFQNISFYGLWVNEISYTYFEDWEDRIKTKINNIADLDSPSKVKFIKVFQQDVLQKYNDLSKVDYDSLEILKTIPRVIFMTNSYVEPPKSKGSEIYYSGDFDDGFEEILQKMAEVYKVETFDYYDGEHSPDSQKDILEDEILCKLNLEEEHLESLYSYTYLSLTLESTRELLGRITKYLDYLVNLINKLENFEEDKLKLDDVFAVDPTDIKLEFKINKLAVAMFYRNLHDLGLIHVDNKNQKTPYTNLKKYINEANIYYLDNNKVNRVKNINKEFSKILNDKYKEYEKQELNLLDLLITNFQQRKAELLNN
ncbi:hypothetical protein [Winogradskyella poriferorum]|uniref:hypothetical protein n=1 Tax=Winogradskyella poriferorum TaxID=307627 RepID=UPI003D64DFB0